MALAVTALVLLTALADQSSNQRWWVSVAIACNVAFPSSFSWPLRVDACRAKKRFPCATIAALLVVIPFSTALKAQVRSDACLNPASSDQCSRSHPSHGDDPSSKNFWPFFEAQ